MLFGCIMVETGVRVCLSDSVLVILHDHDK